MSDEDVTKVTCLVCHGRGCRGPRDRAHRPGTLSCDGTGMVTPDHQARQRLRWPEKPYAPVRT